MSSIDSKTIFNFINCSYKIPMNYHRVKINWTAARCFPDSICIKLLVSTPRRLSFESESFVQQSFVNFSTSFTPVELQISMELLLLTPSGVCVVRKLSRALSGAAEQQPFMNKTSRAAKHPNRMCARSASHFYSQQSRFIVPSPSPSTNKTKERSSTTSLWLIEINFWIKDSVMDLDEHLTRLLLNEKRKRGFARRFANQRVTRTTGTLAYLLTGPKPILRLI